MLSVTDTDGPIFNTRNQTHEHLSSDTSTLHSQMLPQMYPEAKDPTPKSLTTDRLQALLQMQKTDPFCKQNIQVTIEWESTTTQNWSFHTCTEVYCINT